jgi:hypothetical protein
VVLEVGRLAPLGPGDVPDVLGPPPPRQRFYPSSSPAPSIHLGGSEWTGRASTAPRQSKSVIIKGLTDETLPWQTERFLELETERSGITVYIRPEIVVEIALDGAQASTRYPGGVALRFARVKRYRPDKDPAEADTIDAVRTLLAGEHP